MQGRCTDEDTEHVLSPMLMKGANGTSWLVHVTCLGCRLTLSPLCVCLNDPVNVGGVLESLSLTLSHLLRVPSLVLSKQIKVQHHLSLQRGGRGGRTIQCMSTHLRALCL